ncbi:glycosyltransferase family 1 protein [Rhodovulum sp. 12E13]|uniref:glycosyltransferase family protein n=1 Tax=Rhodovulum sp. 12E13 TaxID=2203891 RepID=UPI000E1A78B7|nr:glycosyltransferase [Rhodovulum sp. 12E13]RDC71212.1 glycosyltransferase family 1 protein [Rhodovulum sp. 12E13]
MAARAIPWPLRRLAARPRGRLTRPLHARLYGRPFAPGAGRRLLVLFEPGRISYASAYPFVLHARAFAERHGAQIRLLETGVALAQGLPPGLARPTHVIAQSWLLDPPERHDALARLLGGLPEGTVTAYLDTSANADIRLARPFSEVDLYFKKSLFADRAAHLRPTAGDTNLTEYYGHLFGMPEATVDWAIPQSILPKLRVAPNFLTAPGLAEGFLARRAPPDGQREIDLHVRLGGTRAGGWYGAMRRAAEAAAQAVPGLATVSGSGVAPGRFMAELRASKMCFSPFGFGELCWRDIEAILAGAVLLKPDMSHLDTAPDLYRDGETYVALKWDFSDLAEQATTLAADPERRGRIARAAHSAARAYLENDGPAGTYAPLFM